MDAARWDRPLRSGLLVAEVVAPVVVATALVAALERVVAPRDLGVVYLLAVLTTAVRRGQIAALASALLGVVTWNFLFIPPRHTLAIGSSHDLAVLVVFLIAALVVGRLATLARDRAAEAEWRARVATGRERESALVAEAAAGILGDRALDSQLALIGERVAAASGAASARIGIEATPAPRPGETAIRLPTSDRPGWLYVAATDGSWSRADLDRLAGALARLIDVAVERDRVAAREAEAEELRRSGDAKTAVLHAVSHDLRSPLTAITTASAALGEQPLDDADRGELATVIQEEAARLARLVDDLLDLSRIEAGATHPRADWCDLGDVVAGAAAHVRALHGEHPVELALPADLPLVRADAAQLERVFSNLIENAVKFSPPGEPVRVTGGVGGSRVTVRVVDRGRGVPNAQRAHVFEPFFRGRGSGSGSGLGLAICRGLVEANDGRILLQNGAPGEGTAFAVSFPLVAQPAPTP